MKSAFQLRGVAMQHGSNDTDLASLTRFITDLMKNIFKHTVAARHGE